MKSVMKWVVRAPLILVGLVVLGELAIRGGILMKLSFVRNPDLYCDWTSDEDFWKLRHIWIAKVTPESKEMIDPMLGWVTPSSAGNPLGATVEAAYVPDFTKPAVLMVGDSFVQGVGEMPKRIPQQLSAMMKPVPVYNLGVAGYGVDQVYMRAQQMKSKFKQPWLVAGIFTAGVDRTILPFRTGPKPYFAVAGESISLRGVPVAADPETWLKDHPPRERFYLLSLIQRVWQRRTASNVLELPQGQNEKREVNTALLKEFVKYFREEHVPLQFVLFYNREELAYTGWREKFVLETLQSLRADPIDTKQLFLKAAKEKGVLPQFFYSKDGHLNAEGNKIVAEAVYEKLKSDAGLARELASPVPAR